jgi:hypothetical protein
MIASYWLSIYLSLIREISKGNPSMSKRHSNLTLLLTLTVLLLTPATSRADDGSPGMYFFTGYKLSEPFLSYWQNNGGLDRFGYPISDVIHDPASGLDVQYVERGRLELHHTDSSDMVMLGRIGADVIEAEHCSFPPAAADEGNYFAETGYRVPPIFFDYWQNRGGLASYGYPLSPAYTDSSGMLVQWFERARFELHPENAGTPYNVLLAPLGRDLLARRDALMPYLRVSGDKLVFGSDDTVVQLKGVNYSPSQHPWKLWQAWDEPTVQRDFALMHDLGSNTVRVFVTIGDWQNGYFTPARMEGLLQIASGYGIRPIISLFDSYLKYPTPGWDNWPTDDSDPRTATEYAYLDAVVKPYALDTRIAAWDICNEVDYVIPYTEWVWKDHAANRLAWLRRIAAYVRTLDRAHPLTVGLTTHYGLNQPVAAADGVGGIVDYVSFHYYEHNYYDRDLTSLLDEMRGYNDKPVVVEEIGHPSGGTDLPHASEPEQQAFYAKMLPQAAQGSAGALAWSLLDWPSLSGSEANFGLYRADYSPKPAAATFRDAMQVATFPNTNPSAGVPLFCAIP